MIITVKILRGRECTIEAPVNSSVSFIKQLVARELDVPVDKQRLLFRGKTLADSQCLRDYNIVDGNKLHLVVRNSELGSECGSSESSIFYTELRKTLSNHFSPEDVNKVLDNFKKEMNSVVYDSSLDDIERFAMTCSPSDDDSQSSSTTTTSNTACPS